ncbi:hypothetical protein LIQ92_17640, partial [Fusicatenibacter saccharivorans]|nr:hypothetical protein [Fusicatenibacter saccharivorans]
GYYFSAKVTGRSNLANAGCAASEAQKSSSPLSSVFFRFSLVRLSLPPSRGRKIIPEAANRPNKGKQKQG